MTHADRDGSERELSAYLAADKAEPTEAIDADVNRAKYRAERSRREAAERALADERAKVAQATETICALIAAAGGRIEVPEKLLLDPPTEWKHWEERSRFVHIFATRPSKANALAGDA